MSELLKRVLSKKMSDSSIKESDIKIKTNVNSNELSRVNNSQITPRDYVHNSNEYPVTYTSPTNSPSTSAFIFSSSPQFSNSMKNASGGTHTNSKNEEESSKSAFTSHSPTPPPSPELTASSSDYIPEGYINPHSIVGSRKRKRSQMEIASFTPPHQELNRTTSESTDDTIPYVHDDSEIQLTQDDPVVDELGANPEIERDFKFETNSTLDDNDTDEDDNDFIVDEPPKKKPCLTCNIHGRCDFIVNDSEKFNEFWSILAEASKIETTKMCNQCFKDMTCKLAVKRYSKEYNFRNDSFTDSFTLVDITNGSEIIIGRDFMNYFENKRVKKATETMKLLTLVVKDPYENFIADPEYIKLLLEENKISRKEYDIYTRYMKNKNKASEKQKGVMYHTNLTIIENVFNIIKPSKCQYCLRTTSLKLSVRKRKQFWDNTPINESYFYKCDIKTGGCGKYIDKVFFI